MTSRPAVPESDTPTPLSDAFTEELLRMAGTPWGWSDEERKDLRRRILESHESLERRLSLAQTEINGRMRVEDDLKAELREADAAAQRWYLAASPYATPTALSEALAELKANNAELEKDNKLWHANWEAAHAEVQEARNFIVEQSKGNLGGGEKPVEFLLASYKLMAHERAQAEKDVARYRFIRRRAYVAGNGWMFSGSYPPIDQYAYNLKGKAALDDCDASIDAARKDRA